MQQWTGAPLTFTAALSWTVEHDWGTFQPYVVVTRDDGRPMEIGPEYTDGQVVVTFNRPTAGTLSLTGPGGTGGTSIANDLTGPAAITPGTPARATGRNRTPVIHPGTAVIKPGQGAVVQ